MSLPHLLAVTLDLSRLVVTQTIARFHSTTQAGAMFPYTETCVVLLRIPVRGALSVNGILAPTRSVRTKKLSEINWAIRILNYTIRKRMSYGSGVEEEKKSIVDEGDGWRRCI